MSGQIFLLGILCVSFVSAIPSDHLYRDEHELKGLIDGLINDTINNLVASLPEPIAIDSLPINFNSSIISGDANLSSFSLSGLKKLVATKIDIALLSLAMNATIVVPVLSINTRYYADVVLASLLPLYGGGRAGIAFDDIEIALGGKVSITGGLSIQNVTVQIGLGEATFDLHGLLNDEDFSALVNQVLNDNVAPFLNDYKEVIGNIISPIAQELINAILAPNKTVNALEGLDLHAIEQIVL